MDVSLATTSHLIPEPTVSTRRGSQTECNRRTLAKWREAIDTLGRYSQVWGGGDRHSDSTPRMLALDCGQLENGREGCVTISLQRSLTAHESVEAEHPNADLALPTRTRPGRQW